jgi:hypothetical protein
MQMVRTKVTRTIEFRFVFQRTHYDQYHENKN